MRKWLSLIIVNLERYFFNMIDFFFQEHELYPQRANRKKVLDIEFSFAEAPGGNDRGRGRGGRGKIKIIWIKKN